MVDRELLKRRLDRLEEYLSILERLRSYSYEEFISNPERYGSAERFLQLSIELLNDLGNHVIADERLGAVESAGRSSPAGKASNSQRRAAGGDRRQAAHGGNRIEA